MSLFFSGENMKSRIRVQLENFSGVEAGIDGGGLFREFMTELVKTAFDPTRGLFIATHDRALYPNPHAALLFESTSVLSRERDFLEHFRFLGRVVGKALFEGILVELPFAQFFLAKILARDSAPDTLTIDYLDSLDPEVYKYAQRFTVFSNSKLSPMLS